MSSGLSWAYGTPLGLIAKTPRSLSAALAFPKVNSTNPNSGSCILASYACRFISLKSLMLFGGLMVPGMGSLFYHFAQRLILFINFLVGINLFFLRVIFLSKAAAHGPLGFSHIRK